MKLLRQAFSMTFATASAASNQQAGPWSVRLEPDASALRVVGLSGMRVVMLFLALGTWATGLPSHVAADTVDQLVRLHVEGTPDVEAQTELLRAAFEQFRQQKFAESLEQLTQAHQTYPALPPGRISLALFFLDIGQTRQSQQQLELAALLHSDSPLTFDAFGRLALVEGRLTDATVHWDRTLKLMTESNWDETRMNRLTRECELGLATVAERRGQWSPAQELLQRVLDRSPEDTSTRRRLAQAMFRSDQSDEAYRELIKTTETEPTFEPAELTMARFCTGQSKHDQAETWIKKAIEKHPDNTDVTATYGSWLLDRNRAREAAAQAKLALKVAPDNPMVKALVGSLAMTVGKYEHAERSFQELYASEPDNLEYSIQLSLSLIEQPDREKQQRALKLAETNARKYPRNEKSLATLGWAYYRVGRGDDARKLLQGVISSGRASADTVYFYARAIADDSRIDEVRSLLKKAIESDGRFVHRNDAKAWLEQIPQEENEPAPELP